MPTRTTRLDAETQRQLELEYALRVHMEQEIAHAAVWEPRSVVQQTALDSPADELFFGGAGGGGKTDLLIGVACTQHRRSIIFRREFPQLREIIMRLYEILGDTDAKYNQATHVWRNIPGGRMLELGAVQHDAHKSKYQGRAHDFKGYDELPQFTKEIYKFTSGWLRTTVPDQRTRIIGAGNPPMNAEGYWVIDYWGPWLNKSDPLYGKVLPGELVWYITDPADGSEHVVENPERIYVKGLPIDPVSRTFIPATLADNPYLRNTRYASVVNALPEPMRSRMLFGDFEIKPEDRDWQIVPSAWFQAATERWRRRGAPSAPISVISIDVAHGGSDKTTIGARYGDFVDAIARFPGSETQDGRAVVVKLLEAFGLSTDTIDTTSWASTRFGQIPIHIDAVGYGASAFDELRALGFNVWPVIGNEGTEATDYTEVLPLTNKRAEMYWRLREALDPALGSTLALPPDHELEIEITAPTWTMGAQGIQVLRKIDVKSLIGRSPDKADCIAQMFLDYTHDYSSYPTSSAEIRLPVGASPHAPILQKQREIAAQRERAERARNAGRSRVPSIGRPQFNGHATVHGGFAPKSGSARIVYGRNGALEIVREGN
jgi:hypothetical protein